MPTPAVRRRSGAASWVGAAWLGAAVAAVASGGERTLPAAQEPGGLPDPGVFFDRLVERYRGLDAYRDTAEVVYVTEREGEEPRRVESRIVCEIQGDRLSVKTPASQVREAIGVNSAVPRSPAMETMVLRYQLWIAPHMALRFTDDPRRQLRAGVEEGFTPTRVEAVAERGRTLLRLELLSGEGLSEEHNARFELFVNPATLLIERIEGEQRLPDGAQYRTTLRIIPDLAEPVVPAA